jgi:hypothetical protein
MEWGYSGNTSVVSTKARTGTYSLQCQFGTDYYAEQMLSLGASAQVTEVWFEWYQWFADGTEGLGSIATHITDLPGSDNNKGIRVWPTVYDGDGWGYKVGFSFDAARDGSQAMYCYNEIRNGSGMSPTGSGFAIAETSLGKWVLVRLHYKCATVANNDGVIYLEIDGVSEGATNVANYNSTENWMRNVRIFGATNRYYSDVTRWWIDDFKVYTSDPGW